MAKIAPLTKTEDKTFHNLTKVSVDTIKYDDPYDVAPNELTEVDYDNTGAYVYYISGNTVISDSGTKLHEVLSQSWYNPWRVTLTRQGVKKMEEVIQNNKEYNDEIAERLPQILEKLNELL